MLATCIAHITEQDAERVAQRAGGLWERLATDPRFDDLVAECSHYNSNWSSSRGVLAAPGVDFAVDGIAYVEEGLRLACINAAAGGMVSAPSRVDAALHAVMAQTEYMRFFETAYGLVIRHSTREELTMSPYVSGCLTDQIYELAFGRTPDRRFWSDQELIDRQAAALNAHLEEIGVYDVAGVGVRVEDGAFADV